MNASSFIESQLSVTLPEDYKLFLDTTGYLSFSNISQEVYGYKHGFEVEKLPCVIGATKKCKADYGLGAEEIVLSHAGYRDRIIVLDAMTSRVFELSLDGYRKLLADSFSRWLSDTSKKNEAVRR